VAPTLPARAEVALSILERHAQENGGEFSSTAARILLAHNGPFSEDEATTWLEFLENTGFVYPVDDQFRVTLPATGTHSDSQSIPDRTRK
jgi:hypothetical protein